MFRRNVQPAVEEALADTPAVMVVGARQTGKSTLARLVMEGRRGAEYVTFDDGGALDVAQSDPSGFISARSSPLILDEVQKVPALLPAIKAAIDRDRRPGRFLLTGSADVLALPRVSESLAGRMELVTLWPLSQGELRGHREGFVDAVLRGERPAARGDGEGVVDRLLRGGYPEVVSRPRPERRRAYFDAYVTTMVKRDVRELADVAQPEALKRLLRLLAVRTGSLVNHSELGRTLGLPASTLKRYLALLETLFLVHEVPAWASNRGKRLARAPKLHVADTGLAASVAGLDASLLARDRSLLGPLLESFVAGELRKQCGWSEAAANLFHFRTHGGQEVDLVLEDARGRVVGVEVKAASTVTSADLSGLRGLAEAAGKSFVQGIVLHLGHEAAQLGPGLTALPVEALWAKEG